MLLARLQNERGTTMAELIMTLSISLVTMTGMYALLQTQDQLFSSQDFAGDMERTARAAMSMITHDLRMSGYVPVLGSVLSGIVYNSSQLRLISDLNGNGLLDGGNEDISYTYDPLKRRIIRTSKVGQIIFPNIQAFTFSYLDRNGNPTTMSANIRAVLVSITATTAKPDRNYPANNGYRTTTLQSQVALRNLNLGL